MKLDPSKFVDLSSKTIMPVFNENDFLFKIERREFEKGSFEVDFDITLNNTSIGGHKLDLARYIVQNAVADSNNDEEKVHTFKTSLALYEKQRG